MINVRRENFKPERLGHLGLVIALGQRFADKAIELIDKQ